MHSSRAVPPYPAIDQLVPPNLAFWQRLVTTVRDPTFDLAEVAPGAAFLSESIDLPLCQTAAYASASAACL